MSKYDELQAGHQRLLEQREQGGDPAVLLQAAQTYIEQIKAGAQDVPDLRDRSQLRANLRFWAAFVFEQTKTYPDTTLRPYSGPAVPEAGPSTPPPEAVDFGLPSAGPVEAAAGRPKFDSVPATIGSGAHDATVSKARRLPVPLLIAIFAGLILVCGGGYAILSRLGGKQPPIPTTTPAGAISSSDTPALTTAPTILPRTATVPASLTQVAPTRTRTPLPLPTSGAPGQDFLPFQAQVTGAPPAQCSTNQFTLTVDFSAALKAVLAANAVPGRRLEPLRVTVSKAGAGEVAASGSVRWDPASGPLEFQRPPEDQTLLVQVDQVDQPWMVFDTVIVQFQAACQRGQVTVRYAPDASASSQAIRNFLTTASASAPGPLTLDWRLATWGPSPFGDGWVAQLTLLPRGGDGRYIFWADQDKSGPQRLADNQLVLQGDNCQSTFVQVGVTSNGKSTLRALLFHPPVCP